MKEKIDAIIAQYGRDFYKQISDSPDVIGKQILAEISRGIKKVKNNYYTHRDEPFDNDDEMLVFVLDCHKSYGFEKCRNKILNLLKEGK